MKIAVVEIMYKLRAKQENTKYPTNIRTQFKLKIFISVEIQIIFK